MTSPGQTAEELALMGAGWCAESLVLTRADLAAAEAEAGRLRVAEFDLVNALAAAEARANMLQEAADARGNERLAEYWYFKAKLAKATAVVEAAEVVARVLGEEHIEEDGGCFACEVAWPCYAGDLILALATYRATPVSNEGAEE